MPNQLPVILDTDIGSDIDDAVALAYLLKQPRCELLGVTTVTGDVAQRAALAQIVCQSAGRKDVPIHCGAATPLYFGPGQPEVPQYEPVKDLPHRLDWPKHTAVDFLRRTIRSRPGEVTLLTIGPLTNIALLFALDPEIPAMLKSLVSMAGVFFPSDKRREWNCLVDPIATAMVYAARPNRHVSIGLDVTMKCQMQQDEVRRRFQPPPLDVVARMAKAWKHEVVTFHDPLAAAVIFKPELCTYVDGRIDVSAIGDKETDGATTFTRGGTPAPHRVAETVDSDAFFKEYFAVTAGGKA
jgi:purine nucleosidase